MNIFRKYSLLVCISIHVLTKNAPTETVRAIHGAIYVVWVAYCGVFLKEARTFATWERTDAGEHPPSLVRRATQASREMASYRVSSKSGEIER